MRGAVLRGRTSVAALGTALVGFALAAPALATGIELPSGGQVVAGSAALGTTGNQLTVDQTSANAIIDWQSFSIGAGAAVNFNNGSGATLNRVTGGNLSAIAGQLSATGSVYLINPAGIVVDSTGKILTGGSFIASTRPLDADSFMSGGDLRFDGNSTGGVENRGSIRAGGDVVLIGSMAVNSGSIAADGTVGLVAADHIMLAASDRGQRITIDYGAGDVTNSGTIAAASAELRAASGNVYALAGNIGGIISVVGSARQDGRIWLSAGKDVTVSGTVTAKNADGSGGTVHVLGSNIALTDGAAIDVSGTKGGTALIGGDYKGGSDSSRRYSTETLRTASNVDFAAGASVRADATGSGDGGAIVLWSDDSTIAHGSISARGGLVGGNGGFVETSSEGLLSFRATVDTGATNGTTGILLLDPRNITISTAATTAGPSFPSWNAAADSSIINVTDLQNAVIANNVVVTTGTTGTQNGDITVANAITLTGANSLTLTAAGSFTNNAAITLAQNNLTINAVTGITIGAVISKEGGTVGQTSTITLSNTGATSDININARIAAGNLATSANNLLAVNATSARDILFAGGVSGGQLVASGTGGTATNNILTATLTGRDISFDGATTTLQIVDGGATSVLTVNANASRNITLNKTVNAAAAVAGPADRNTINLNFNANGNISFTAGEIGSEGTFNANSTDFRSMVNVNWKAGGGTGAVGDAISVTSTSTNSFDLRGGSLRLETLTTGPVGGGATSGGNIMTAATASNNGIVSTLGGDLTMITAVGAISINNQLVTGQGTAANNNLDTAVMTLTSATSITTGNFTAIQTSGAGSSSVLTASNGAISLGTATITTSTATFSATATDTITALGAFSTVGGNLSLTSTRNGAGNAIVTSGTSDATGIATAGGNVTLTASGTNAGMSVGHINPGTNGGSITLDARGSVVQTGLIQSSAPAGGGIRLLGAGASYNLTNPANNLGATASLAANTGSIAFTAVGSVNVGTVLGTAGVTTTGITQISAATAVTQNQPIVSAGLLVTSANSLTLTNTANAVTGSLTLKTTNAEIQFVNSGNVAIGSVTGVGNIATQSGINAGTNDIALTTTGTTTQTQGANVIGAGLLLLGTGGSHQLTSTGNDVDFIAANTGRVTLVDTDGLATGRVTIAGVNNDDLITTGTSTGGFDFTVDLTAGAGGANDFLTITGTTGDILTNETGNVRLIADKMAIVGTVKASTTATSAPTRVVQLTTFTNARAIDFGRASVDTFDTTTLDLGNDELARITAGITRIGSATAGMLTVRANFNSPTNVLSLHTGAGVDQTAGSITVNSGAGDLAVRGVGDINLGTQNNQVAKLAIESTGGNVRFRDDNGFAIDDVDFITTSVVSPGGLLQLVSNATVTQAHSLTAENLRLGSAAALAGTYTLGNAANNFTNVAGRAATLTLTETSGFAVGTVDTLTGLTATGTATLGSTGAVTQSQIITATALNLNGTGGAYTLTSNNQVGTLGGNTTSIDFQNTLAAGLTLDNVTVATTAKITSNAAAGNLIIGANKTIASSATSGDSVVLGTNANFVANAGAAINPGTGTARYLVFTNNTGNATEWTGTVRGSLTGANFYNAAFDVAAARSTAVGAPNLVSSVTGNRFVYADQPTLQFSIQTAATQTYNGLVQNLPSTYTTGLVNADTEAQGYTGAAGSVGILAPVAVYTNVTGTIGTLASPINYAFLLNGIGTMTIEKAPLTITYANKTKVFGAADPALTFTVAGLVNGEAVGTGLSGAGTTYTANGAGGTNITNAVTRAAGETVAGGPYAITTGAGLAATANYTIQSVVNGALTITPAGLTVSYVIANTANTYGTLPTVGAVTLTGVQGADVVNPVVSVTNAMNAAVTLATTTAVGTYTAAVTSLTGAQAGNYTINNVGSTNGTITVNPAPLTLTYANKTKIFGAADPALTFTVAGLVNNETVGTALTGAGTTYTVNGAGGTNITNAVTRTAGETVAGGPYTITTGAGMAATANYTIAIVSNGALTITPATLTANYSIANTTNVYGTLPTVGTVTLTGIQGADVVTPVVSVTNAQNAAVALATTTAVGAYTAAVTSLSGAQAGNYTLATTGNTNGTITVTAAPLTITVASKTKVYGDADPALTFTVAGLVNSETVGTALSGAGTTYTANGAGGTNLTTSLTRTAGETVAGGPYAITTGAGIAATANYSIQTVTNGALTITPAPLAISGTGTKIYGQADPVLTITSSGYKLTDTQASVLTGALTRAAGTNAGTYNILQGTVAANSNYTPTYTPGTFTITPATLVYAVGNTTNVYGTVPTIGTTTLTGLVTGDTVTPVHTVTNAQNATITPAATTGVGTYTAAVTSLTGAQAGNYTLATTGNTNGTITVTKAPLVVTVENKTKVYGDADPALTFTVAGLVNSETVGTGLSGAGTTYTANGAGGTNLTTALTGVAGETVAGGPYALTAGAGLAATANYSLTVVPGALTITPAPLAVTGTGTKVYGQADPVLTITSSGYKLTDTQASVLTGALTRAAGTNAGTYNVLQGTVAANPNYVITYTPGTFTISPATLTYAVGNTTNVYGILPTIGTTVLTGVITGDTVNPVHTVRNGQNAAITLATNTGVGVYSAAVTSLTGAQAGNYTLATTGNTNGTITVTPATLTISPLAATKVYGSTDPSLPYTFAGLVGGDTSSILTGAINRAAGENAGPYNFGLGTLSAGSNYVLALTPPGPVFTITPKPVNFSVANTTSVYGTLGTRGAITLSGILAGDTVNGVYAPVTNSLGQTVALATNTPVGPYGVTVASLAGVSAANYVLATTGNTPGILTVTRAPLVLVIDDKRKPFGSPNPVFTYSATGFVAGDTAATLISLNPADAGTNRLAIVSTALLDSPSGPYPITSAGQLSNYALTVTPGTLTIAPQIDPEPPVAPGTSGGSISSTGLNFTGSNATLTSLVADPGTPGGVDNPGFDRREEKTKNFSIYVEVVPSDAQLKGTAFVSPGDTAVQGSGGATDRVAISSFDPAASNDNPEDLKRRLAPVSLEGGR